MELRGFIHDILGGAVEGMLKGLKGYESADVMNIKVTRQVISEANETHDS